MKINEIFYSLQGEGVYSGTPSVFVRFSGCNLKCPFCDTQHNNGVQMSESEIVEHVNKFPCKHIVLTGGEPSLFITESLVDKLHATGKYVAIETNGTHTLPGNIDWITLSPKYDFCDGAEVILDEADEVKVVFNGQPLDSYFNIKAKHYLLQPCDTGDELNNADNIHATVDACLNDPRWSLSMQTHKYLNIR
jgi:7-carboxy-7-deazaguanine synthase